MADNVPGDYVWRAKSNESFSGQCHVETGGTWLRFEFDSRLGRIVRPQETAGNPLLIITDGGARVALRGAVTIVAPDTHEVSTVTFTPQDEGITDWHWTVTRDGETFTEEGSGIFLRYEPMPEPLPRETETVPMEESVATNVAVKKAVTKKAVAKKIAKKPVAKNPVTKKATTKKAVAKKRVKTVAKKAKNTKKKVSKTTTKKAAPRKKAKAVKKVKKATRAK